MVPAVHTPHHQRRSTYGGYGGYGGASREPNFFSSSMSTTASPPRTPKRDSDILRSNKKSDLVFKASKDLEEYDERM
jgi:hypothetical protein